MHDGTCASERWASIGLNVVEFQFSTIRVADRRMLEAKSMPRASMCCCEWWQTSGVARDASAHRAAVQVAQAGWTKKVCEL
jgi:hypothetical protein